MSELGRLVERRRTDLGLSRRDLAEHSGLSYPYVSQIETGEREPALKAMHALALALDLPVEQLASAASSSWATGASGRPSLRQAAYDSVEPTGRPSAPPTAQRLALSIERRLRDVPPVERLVLLNELVARTLAELQEQQQA